MTFSKKIRTAAEWMIGLVKARAFVPGLAALALMLLIPATGVCQLSRYDTLAIGPRGVPFPNVNAVICSQPANVSTAPCSPLATLFSYGITSVTRGGGSVTVVTSTTNGLSPGMTIVISGVLDGTYNGTFQVATVISNTSFTYLNSGSNGSSSGGSINALNPFSGDALGNVSFYGQPGRYTLMLYGPQLQAPIVMRDITLSCDPNNGCIAPNLSSINLLGSTSGTTTLQATAVASGTITVPAATDTLVGRSTTDTLTGKTFDTAGAGNILKINGTQVSSTTGSGAVALNNAPTFTGELSGKRFNADQGSALVAGDFALSSGWGASAIKSGVTGTDMSGKIDIQANGTTSGNPTVILSFHDGAFAKTPNCVVSRGDGNTPATGFWIINNASSSTTVLQMQFVATPTSGNVYTVNFSCMGT
jgi:hypothetical protein